MKKKITIGYKPDSYLKEIPMIRITNKHLKDYGFNVGDKVEIEYKPNELIVKKVGAHKLDKDKNNGKNNKQN